MYQPGKDSRDGIVSQGHGLCRMQWKLTYRYIKRKVEMDKQAESARLAKIQAAKPKDDDLFGETLQRKPLSPRVTVPSPARWPV
jgi:hypothetical protein